MPSPKSKSSTRKRRVIASQGQESDPAPVIVKRVPAQLPAKKGNEPESEHSTWRKKVIAQARTDIQALGWSPTQTSLEGYWKSVESWESLAHVSVESVTTKVDALLRSIIGDPDCRKIAVHLPIERKTAADRPRRGTISLPDEAFSEWVDGLREIVRVRLIYERALIAREQYLRLKRESLPSAGVFRDCLEHLLRLYVREKRDINTSQVLRIVGESAAQASDLHLLALEKHLLVTTGELRARGNFLSEKSAPKQLGIWNDVKYRLSLCLGRHGTQFAQSKAISAALKIFASPVLVMSEGDITEYARNAVERGKKRISPKRKLEIELEHELRIRAWLMAELNAHGVPD